MDDEVGAGIDEPVEKSEASDEPARPASGLEVHGEVAPAQPTPTPTPEPEMQDTASTSQDQARGDSPTLEPKRELITSPQKFSKPAAPGRGNRR